jgi:hypothetical protein
MKSLAALFFLALTTLAHAEEPVLFPDTHLKKPNYFNDGVVLVYVKDAKPVDGHEVNVALQDTVIVRVRNLDGWLIRRLKYRQITGEPVMSPEQRERFLELQELKKNYAAQDFLKHYEDAALHKALAGTNASPAANPTTPAAADEWPQLSEKKVADLRDSHNAYRALLDYTKSHLYLIINSSHLRGIQADNPEAGEVSNRAAAANPDDTLHEFAFRLRRLDKDLKEWGEIYSGTRGDLDVRVSLGVDFDSQLFALDSAVYPLADNKVQRVRLRLYSPSWLYCVLGGMAIFLCSLVLMGKNSDLLRDTDLCVRADGRPQFSLARIQLAFWLYLVVGAFLIIWLVTDRLDTLNPSILALLGISSGTLLASKLANTFTLTDGQVPADPVRVARAGKSQETLTTELKKSREALEVEARRLDTNPDHLEAQAYEEARRKVEYRIEQTDADLAYLGQSVFSRLILDLLSENGRPSLHRLQIVIWTLVLGVVFLTRVRRELAMPEFSDTLLGLMGISSVTYVALKVPELKRTEAQAKANRADPPAP